MKFPAIPFLTKKVKTEYFLALIFEYEKISTILFREQENKLTTLSSHSVAINIDDASSEDLVVASDNVISKIELSLPDNTNLEKTIFAVPYSWVEDGKIKPLQLEKLKKISTELALTPMGFIVSIEAIIANLQKKEGAPINGIFVELSEKFLTVFVVRAGNIIDIQKGQIVDSVEKTVERLLGHVTKLDVLPPKIILIHTKESEEISQKFLSHHWTKELSFIHLPQVVILDRDFENESLISGVATQLNDTIDGDTNITTQEGSINEELVIEDKDAFGFLKDEDVKSSDDKKEAIDTKEEDNFAFSEDFDSKEKDVVIHHGVKGNYDNNREENFDEDTPEEHRISTDKKGTIIQNSFSYIASFFTPNSFASIPKNLINIRKLLIPIVVLIVIGVLVVIYYNVFLKTQIIITTDKKAIAQDSMDITLTTKGESSFSDRTLRISTIDQEADGEETQETTGQKDTGQKATGTVIIFNKKEEPIKLDKGIIITSSNNLDFLLNDQVNIASTSSFSTSFSSTQAKVTAENFGKEYNIPSQTNFTIKGYTTSELFGRNDSAFSGGTKEEIQVVAAKDLKTLEDTIIKRLFDKAKTQAQSKLTSDNELISEYLSYEFTDKTFDKKVDEKAKNIKLDANISYTLGIYKKSELTNFISSSDKFNVPPSFKLSGADTSIAITDIIQNKSTTKAKLSFNAVFKPQIETKKLIEEISGKSEKEVLKILKSKAGVSDVKIIFPNKIPYLPALASFNKGNISIDLKTE